VEEGATRGQQSGGSKRSRRRQERERSHTEQERAGSGGSNGSGGSGGGTGGSGGSGGSAGGGAAFNMLAMLAAAQQGAGGEEEGQTSVGLVEQEIELPPLQPSGRQARASAGESERGRREGAPASHSHAARHPPDGDAARFQAPGVPRAPTCPHVELPLPPPPPATARSQHSATISSSPPPATFAVRSPASGHLSSRLSAPPTPAAGRDGVDTDERVVPSIESSAPEMSGDATAGAGRGAAFNLRAMLDAAGLDGDGCEEPQGADDLV
jgi:hypothetical protein